MSSFRGSSSQPGPPTGTQGQNSPVLYNPQLTHPHSHPHPHPHPHSQHSPAIQNDTIVGKAIQTMYTTADQSISSFSSNPSTPVNSPPPLTSQQPPHPLHPSTSSQGSTWQQLTPVINGGSSSASINSLQNGSYTPDLVPRGLQHMVK